MRISNPPLAWANWPRLVRLAILSAVIWPLTSWFAVAPRGVEAAEETPPPHVISLPEDSGSVGLQEMLRRLSTTARMMQTVAHPDDEDGGMLTLESRVKGVDTLLLTLNRGEGGQNKLGSNLFDVLGVLRTLELTAADRYYGVQQRFTRVADFGFSKTPQETLQKWNGPDIPLGDMVRVIRTFRPDVLVARFSGTDRDGHGHHQVSSILTREAFRAAADPKKFPEQIQQGLAPWQAKKLYIGNVCGFNSPTCPDADYTVKINTGIKDDVLGTSPIQFAMQGLKHQLSQGAGAWTIDPGDRFTYYKLVDSVTPLVQGHEVSFFDGLDTSIAGLADRLGSEQSKMPNFRRELERLQSLVSKASADVDHSFEPLLEGSALAEKLSSQLAQSSVSQTAKFAILPSLQTKREQFAEAANLAAGIKLNAQVDAPVAATADAAFMAVPGESFRVIAHFTSATPVERVELVLDVPKGWSSSPVGKGEAATRTFEVSVPKDAKFTRPYWHRNNPETDALNTIDDPADVTLPFPAPPVRVRATYAAFGKSGGAHADVTVRYKGAAGEELDRPLAVAPAYSVMLDPGQQVIAVGTRTERSVTVTVSSNLAQTTRGRLHLVLPDGWRSEPAAAELEVPSRGSSKDASFKVLAKDSKEERTEIKAVFEAGGESYHEGYSVVTRDDLSTFYYYQPATQRVSVIDVKIPRDLKIGYIMGAGDEIPSTLQQIGMDVEQIAPDKLATADLSRFGTIVLGIRAYDTQKAVAQNNSRLLDWVKSGGTLVVQYNTGPGDFNQANYTPFPAKLGRARVDVEEAPVAILAPQNPIFHFPNEITARDFEGWVQERGLYFMTDWDGKFTPLLESHDPNEPDQKGGMIEAHYGKGLYIYTGYAFFRQLPAGVPGAVRLYVNILSAKAESH